MQTTGDGKLSSATRLPVLGKLLLYFGERLWGTNSKVPKKNPDPLPEHSSHLTRYMDIPYPLYIWAPQTGSCYGTNFVGEAGVRQQQGRASGFHPPHQPLSESDFL